MARPVGPLKSLVAHLEQGQGVVALFNNQRQLLYANAAAGRWLGMEVDSLLGRTACYATQSLSDPSDTALARIAPPPDAFMGSSSRGVTLAAGAEPCWLQFLPLRDEHGDWAVLVVELPEKVAAQHSAADADWHAALALARAKSNANLQSLPLVGESAGMQRLREQVQLAGKSRARTVVVAPPGSGSTTIAETIHALGSRPGDVLLPVRCEVQDAETIQATIRAIAPHRNSSIEYTLLLQDLSRLNAAAQQELWGFLQLPGFELRLLATSRVSLARLVKRETLLSSLAAALGTLELRVPPLHARAEDVPLLVQAAVEQHNAVPSVRQLRGVVPEALEKLVAYGWPGGVDELTHVVVSGCMRSTGPWLIPGDLPESICGNWQQLAHPRTIVEPIELDRVLADYERELLTRTMAHAKQNKSAAARLLGISRPRLLRRLVQLGLVARDEADAIDFQPLEEDAP